MKKIGVISLGCDKNRVDTEKMLYWLSEGGHSFTHEPADADIIIINTCAFIAPARKEAIDTVLEMAEYKKRGLEKLIVTGCLPEKYIDELREGLPEVDLMIGINGYDGICGLIEGLYKNNPPAANHRPPPANPLLNSNARILTTPQHYAYLKISDGCNNRCAFCTIPSIRGKYREYGRESLISEAKFLAKIGVKELILVAQDVTAYGGLTDLISELEDIDGIEWIRLMYCYPERVTDKLIAKIAASPKICKYIDIPFQHADDGILRLMNRRNNYAQAVGLINRLRAATPDISIRSTFITGFPGETDEAFERLCDFVKQAKLANAGFFAYSREKGTPAYSLSNQVPAAVKNKRVKILADIQKTVVAENNAAMVGKTLRVLYEGIDYNKGLFYGRTEYNAPDIDTKVYFKADFADVGNFYNVLVTGAKGYDLTGVKDK